MKTTRRRFIAGAAAGAGALLSGCRGPRRFPGEILGASASAGHRLRDATFPPPSKTIETGFVIAGAGIAGLSAARRLDRRGEKDFLLLDMEKSPGGNAASGANEVSAYPWGAHYVPLVNEESVEVIALFEELGIIQGRTAEGLAIYNEEFLCSDPMERLFDGGSWHDGLLPQVGISDSDRRQYESFFARMDRFRNIRDAEGHLAFAIPLDLSSRDPGFLALDTLSMSEWMAREGWDSKPLLWHVNYCCRDDYGAGMAYVSAWAGVHYFASRRGVAANADRDAVVTWPEGNGWLVHQLAAPLSSRIRCGCIVWNVEELGSGIAVDYFDPNVQSSIRVIARGAVCALPRFIAARVVRGALPAKGLEYSPWMVANVTLRSTPAGPGVPLAWDNVSTESDSLGYVVATHQQIRRFPPPGTVLTHYWPLDASSPVSERKLALPRNHSDWCGLVVADLRRFHPGIEREIQRIDVWVWGHGMIRPVPGFIWGADRARMLGTHGRIAFAHSDMSGISIFEEAFTRGVQAADSVLAATA